MAMHIGTANDEVMSDLNTTPLIDVLLVLLVLLLATLPLQTHAVKLDIGQHIGPPPPTPVVVSLDVAFDGAIAWNGRAVSRATLDGLLVKAAHQNPQPEFHITADRLAHYDMVAKVLADAQRLGVRSIGIVNTNQYLP